MTEFELVLLSPDRIPEAAAVAARAMAGDPMSQAIFDSPTKRIRGLHTMFRMTLSSLKRPAIVAIAEGRIVGITAFAAPGECFFKQMEARKRTVRLGGRSISFAIPAISLRLLPGLLRVGPTAMSRMSAWTEVTARHDPADPHHHVELVAVEPDWQGRGIGRAMMARVIDHIRTGLAPEAPAYLETDTDVDVHFYEKLGFHVLDQAEVVGVTIRFMSKDVSAERPAPSEPPGRV